jgi:hypothetical protein
MTRYISSKSLKEYSNEDLINFLENNENMDVHALAGIASEILRRMNLKRPLFSDEEDWGNPLTP